MFNNISAVDGNFRYVSEELLPLLTYHKHWYVLELSNLPLVASVKALTYPQLQFHLPKEVEVLAIRAYEDEPVFHPVVVESVPVESVPVDPVPVAIEEEESTPLKALEETVDAIAIDEDNLSVSTEPVTEERKDLNVEKGDDITERSPEPEDITTPTPKDKPRRDRKRR